jgi:hypothetical protein
MLNLRIHSSKQWTRFSINLGGTVKRHDARTSDGSGGGIAPPSSGRSAARRFNDWSNIVERRAVHPSLYHEG